MLRFIPLLASVDQSPWLSPSDPTLIKSFDLQPSATLPQTVAGLGNRDCDDTTVTTRPALLFQAPLTATACFVSTAFGIAESNGIISFNGTRLAGQTINFSGYLPGLIAVPSSSDVITYTSAGADGLFLHFNRSLPGPITTNTSLNGEITYRFTQPASTSLKDMSGTLLPAQTDSLGFSSNGEWMVVDSPNRALLRINTQTLEVIPFYVPFNYSIGISPGAQTSVSNDGRYVAVASRNFSVFRLFDMSTCGTVPQHISGPVVCQSRDLLPFLQAHINEFFGGFQLRFASNNILTFFGVNTVAGSIKRAHYSLLAPGQTSDHTSYVGMGDSFSSGEGENLGNTYYVPVTDTALNMCHLSTRSYPYLIGFGLALSDFHNVACSGAVMNKVTGIGAIQSLDNAPVESWIPGNHRQIDYLNTTHPSFLTLTIGGNDVGFADILTECATSHFTIPLPVTCKYASDPEERGKIAERIADQFSNLKATYKAIIRQTQSRSKLYVVGYPQFIQAVGGSCGLNVHLNDAERQLVTFATHYMDQVIKAAADASGAYYLDTENALAGFNLCSIVQDRDMAVNGLTEGDDKHLPWWGALAIDQATRIAGIEELGIGNESFHPNANGHRLLYEKILQLTGGDPSSFNVCTTPGVVVCPKTVASVPLPDGSYFGSNAVTFAASLATSNSPPLPAPPTHAKLLASDSSSSNAHLQLGYLLPGAAASVTTNFGQTSLGSYGVNTSGVLDISVSLLHVPAGFHALHISAVDMAGQSRDYFQTVFVPGPPTDINGNGINDLSESCGFSNKSGIDIDQDGIDDACDGYIGLPPQPKVAFTVRTLSATSSW